MSDTSQTGQTIAKQVPAADSGKLTLPIDAPGTVEKLKLRIYAGAENDLHLRPQIKANNAYSNLLDYAGKDYVDGDDDTWTWDLSEPIRKDEELVIRYDNKDGANAHNFRATFSVDHLGGVERAVSAVRSILPGVGN